VRAREVAKLNLAAFGLASALLVSCSVAPPPELSEPIAEWKTDYGEELIGTKVPEFDALTWVNSPPLTIASLKGKPVYLRFWRRECPNCKQTIPMMNYLYKTYSSKGLAIVGICFGSFSDADTAKVHLAQWGIKFPVALDHRSNTLQKFWAGTREYSSVSMLIDRDGVIRWLHPGGVLGLPPSMGGYEDCPAFYSLEKEIDRVMAAKELPKKRRDDIRVQ